MSIWAGEPRLSDLLADPILLLLAERDGVSLAELRRLIDRLRPRLARSKRPIC